MRFLLVAQSMLLAAVAAGASAQGIVSRPAEAVQPRHAPAVQPREASAVQPRLSAPLSSTAVEGRPADWRWTSAGDTGIAGEGVARGSQLKNVRCAGVACRVFEDSAGAWTVRAEGGFPAAQGRTLEVLVMDTQTRQQQGASRMRGVFSDGSFWDQLDTARLPPGSYAVFYRWAERDQVLAAMTFDVLRHTAPAAGTSSGTPAGDAHARQRARDTALQNQRCLAMAATNPDIRCVPQ